MGRFLRRLHRPWCPPPAASAGLVLAVAPALAATLVVAACAPATVATVEEGVVVRAVDGDTLVVRIEGREEKVRLLGVDTPESVHPRQPVERFGKEAAAFTRRMAEGKTVRLRDDPSNANQDRYGRLLRYVFLPDGSLLNAAIIGQGYGHAYTSYPFEKMEEFRALERQAREKERGLWAPASGDPTRLEAATAEPVPITKNPGGSTVASDPPGASSAGTGPSTGAAGKEYPARAPANGAAPAPRSITGTEVGTATRVGKPEEIVYVTRTGTRYHGESCGRLARSAMPVKLGEAGKRYLPCTLCRPPVLASPPATPPSGAQGAQKRP